MFVSRHLFQRLQIKNEFRAYLGIVLEVNHLGLGRDGDGVGQPSIEQITVPNLSFQRLLDTFGIDEPGRGRRLAPYQSEQIRPLAMLLSLLERMALAAVTYRVRLCGSQIVRRRQ